MSRLNAAAPRLLAELQAVEFGGQADHPDGGYYDCCPSCEGARPDNRDVPKELRGHTDDCTLAAAVLEAGGRLYS